MLDGSGQQYRVAMVGSGSTSLSRLGVSSAVPVETASQALGLFQNWPSRQLSTSPSPAISPVTGSQSTTRKNFAPLDGTVSRLWRGRGPLGSVSPWPAIWIMLRRAYPFRLLRPPSLARGRARGFTDVFISRGGADLPDLSAKAILNDVKLKGEAVRALTGAFYANISRLAQSRKRQDVEDLARTAHLSLTGVNRRGCGHCSPSYRFQKRRLSLGRTALGAREGAVRGHHLAGESPFPAQTALLRGRDPKDKAAELKFQDIAQGSEVLERRRSAPRWPFRTHVVTNRWLLREL